MDAQEEVEHEAPTGVAEAGVMAVLRRGVEVTPELRIGMWFTILLAMAAAAGRLIVPVLIQIILDRGVLGDVGFRPGFVATACVIAIVLIFAIAALNRGSLVRLVATSQHSLHELRMTAFDHIHRLSIADQTLMKRGTLTARVTSDMEQLAMFLRWGAINWIISVAIVIGTLATMAYYSWQLTLVVIVVYLPMVPFARFIQRGQFAAYDQLRNRVGDTLNVTSEIVMGAPVVRAYGYREKSRARMAEAIDGQYRAQMRAMRFFALGLPLTDVFGGLALAATVGVGVWQGDNWGISAGVLVAFLFLVNLLLGPVTMITEVLDQTQTAFAGWRKVLAVIDLPVEVADPVPGAPLPSGALAVQASAVDFRYREGEQVLSEVDVEIPAGARVAIVGETGSGKTTFARLIARLADPTAGQVTVGGVDLRDVAGADRRRAIRMVPQDGFLFDGTIEDNVGFGRAGATPEDVRAAFEELTLSTWIAELRAGLATEVGERGESLSVGERQLVALARAQLADPGLLILDEATSAVDPETEQTLARALDRLSSGRTTISIAHRLSTAQSADLVLVFDRGRLVEHGHHDELVAAGGVYAGLFASWLGNTREPLTQP